MKTKSLTTLSCIGWDVGGWDCDKNTESRDAIVILDHVPAIVGRPWRGNLRSQINETARTEEFVNKLFILCTVDPPPNTDHVTLAIDAPLGFSSELVGLATSLKFVDQLGRSDTNPYLFRQTERYLLENGLKPLSAIKDMIGSQATKGMHVLAKFACRVERCGVWSDRASLTVIEAYPSACKGSRDIETLLQRIENPPNQNDKMDALTCALIAYLFALSPHHLMPPSDSVPKSEGWIWIPKDILKGTRQ